MDWVWNKGRNTVRPVDWNAPVERSPLVRLERLYDWERGCRGYDLFPHPVALEPPFYPYAQAAQGYAPSSSSQVPSPVVSAPDLTFFTLQVPTAQKVTPGTATSLLRTLWGEREISSFEIIGTQHEIAYQWGAPLAQMQSFPAAVQAHFPKAEIHEVKKEARTLQEGSDDDQQPDSDENQKPDLLRQALEPLMGLPVGFEVVEMGLKNFTFLPLRLFSNFTVDPQAALLSTLSQLKEGEVAGVQVLMVPAYGAWQESLAQVAGEFDQDAQSQSPAARGISTRPGGSSRSGANSRWGSRQRREATTQELIAQLPKLQAPLFACVIRIFAVSPLDGERRPLGGERAFEMVRRLMGSLQSLGENIGNELVPLSNQAPLSNHGESFSGDSEYSHSYDPQSYDPQLHFHHLLQRVSCRPGMLLSLDELAGLVHPPSENLGHAKLLRTNERGGPLPMHLKNIPGSLLGYTPSRGREEALVWPAAFRTRHCSLLGATRMGKSTLMLNLLYQDMLDGKGVCLIDPHGDLANDALALVPPERAQDCYFIQFSDTDYPLALGMLEAEDEFEQQLLVSDLLSILKRFFTGSWGDRLEHVLRLVLSTLIQDKGEKHTLRDVRRLLMEEDYRDRLLERITDRDLRLFWNHEFPDYTAASLAPIYNKLGLLTTSPLMRNIVAQKEGKLSISRAMREGRIVIVNLSSSLIGEDNARFLGALLISKFQIAAMQSLRYAKEDRPLFTIYADEFQHFVVSSFETILSEAGKAQLSLVMANQFLEQLPGSLQSAILGNVGTLVSFRVSAQSGRVLEKEFGGIATADDMVKLSRGQAVVKLSSAQDTRRIRTLPPPALPRPEGQSAAENQAEAKRRREFILEQTQREICRPRAEVERELDFQSRLESQSLEAQALENKPFDGGSNTNSTQRSFATENRSDSTGNASPLDSESPAYDGVAYQGPESEAMQFFLLDDLMDDNAAPNESEDEGDHDGANSVGP